MLEIKMSGARPRADLIDPQPKRAEPVPETGWDVGTKYPEHDWYA